jgi:hypothetical protein
MSVISTFEEPLKNMSLKNLILEFLRWIAVIYIALLNNFEIVDFMPFVNFFLSGNFCVIEHSPKLICCMPNGITIHHGEIFKNITHYVTINNSCETAAFLLNDFLSSYSFYAAGGILVGSIPLVIKSGTTEALLDANVIVGVSNNFITSNFTGFDPIRQLTHSCLTPDGYSLLSGYDRMALEMHGQLKNGENTLTDFKIKYKMDLLYYNQSYYQLAVIKCKHYLLNLNLSIVTNEHYVFVRQATQVTAGMSLQWGLMNTPIFKDSTFTKWVRNTVLKQKVFTFLFNPLSRFYTILMHPTTTFGVIGWLAFNLGSNLTAFTFQDPGLLEHQINQDLSILAAISDKDSPEARIFYNIMLYTFKERGLILNPDFDYSSIVFTPFDYHEMEDFCKKNKDCLAPFITQGGDFSLLRIVNLINDKSNLILS